MIDRSPTQLIFGTNAAGAGRFRAAVFDPLSGAIGDIRPDAAANAPFFFALSADRRFLYACVTVAGNTTMAGAIAAYAVEADGLRHLNTVPVDGIETCHLSLDRAGRHLLHASYVSATIGVIALQADGALGATTAQHRFVTAGSIVADRQGEAHTHSIITDPTDRFALIADLGSDCLWLFGYADGALMGEPRRIDLQPGDGPRHILFHPDGTTLFVVCELSNVVASFGWDASSGTLEPQQRVSLLPDDFAGTSYAAEILCDTAGNRLYVSNRGADTIVVFDISAGRLQPLQTVSSRGEWPRSMAIDPIGHWLGTANHRSGNAALFRIDPATGQLTPEGEPLPLPEGFGIAFTG